MEITYNYNGTKTSIECGKHELVFKLTIGTKSFTVIATDDEAEKLRSKLNVMDWKDFEWKNIVALESLCKMYYIVITEEQ
jgi:hypothetical protein